MRVFDAKDLIEGYENGAFDDIEFIAKKQRSVSREKVKRGDIDAGGATLASQFKRSKANNHYRGVSDDVLDAYFDE